MKRTIGGWIVFFLAVKKKIKKFQLMKILFLQLPKEIWWPNFSLFSQSFCLAPNCFLSWSQNVSFSHGPLVKQVDVGKEPQFIRTLNIAFRDVPWRLSGWVVQLRGCSLDSLNSLDPLDLLDSLVSFVSLDSFDSLDLLNSLYSLDSLNPLDSLNSLDSHNLLNLLDFPDLLDFKS